MINDKKKYFADIAIPPGETLLETIDALGMSQAELSDRMGMAKKTINEIVKGKAPITQETALKLENVLGAPASFWNNLESNYQEALARIKAQEEMQEEIYIAKQIPYSELASRTLVSATRNPIEKVKNLRSFFGVASLKRIPSVSASFRRKESENTSEYALAAWLRQGELESRKVQTDPFNKSKLKKLLPKFRQLTLMAPEEFYPEMVTLCASCGIALTIVKPLPKTYICGATNWINKNKAIIELSVRGGRADIFWFTFFHEVAHIILHDEKEFHIQKTDEECIAEDEANITAGNWLIPKEQYETFIKSNQYLTKIGINQFAQKIGIHPCIVIGRLQHEKRIGYNQYNDLIPIFRVAS